jgi:hypothetical protein
MYTGLTDLDVLVFALLENGAFLQVVQRVRNDVCLQYRIFRLLERMSRILPMREGRLRKNQICATGDASSFMAKPFARTLAEMTSMPHFSHTTPGVHALVFAAIAFEICTGPKILAQKDRPVT